MSTFDCRCIETTPGAAGPFAPPLGFEGSAADYGAWLTRQHEVDPGLRQCMYVLWRFRKLTGTGQPGAFQGPYAERLAQAMERYESRMTRRAKEDQAQGNQEGPR